MEVIEMRRKEGVMWRGRCKSEGIKQSCVGGVDMRCSDRDEQIQVPRELVGIEGDNQVHVNDWDWQNSHYSKMI